MKKVSILSLLIFLITSCGNPTTSTPTEAPTEDPTSNPTQTEEPYVSDEEYYKDFKPILRFAIASDVHIQDAHTVKNDRLKKMIEMSYDIAEKSETDYKMLDLIAFAGDMVDTGTITQFNTFKNILDENVKDGTEIITTLGNHEFFSGVRGTIDRYLSVFTETEEDFHTMVNGYHFISICPTEYDNYSTKKAVWLEEHIKIAEEDNPGKPIFFINHHAVLNTVYGTLGANWGSNAFKPVLERHPNVVNFAGHSHYPIADPRSMHHGKFVTVNTGTLAYYELGINDFQMHDIFPTDKNGGYTTSRATKIDDAGDFHIVEVDKTGSMRLMGYDVVSESQMFTRYLRYPIVEEHKKTYEKLKEESPIPTFKENAEVTLVNQSNNSLVLGFKQADSEGYIESYRAEIYKDGEFYKKGYALACNFFFPNPEVINMTITGLTEATEYTIKIYAVNAYGLLSPNYLETTVSTS